jgi:hypothetical protein
LGQHDVPTNPGVPMPMQPAGLKNPFDWLNQNQNEANGIQQSAAMRGQPVALAWWQRRTVPEPTVIGQGVPFYLTSTPYSRGAGAHAPQFGKLTYNPIGAGVASSWRLPTIAGPGARYAFSAIWFDVQDIPTSMGFSQSVPQETVDALIQSSHVSGFYPIV